jgi:hypothetical protein
LINKIKAINPATKGKISITNPAVGFIPRRLRSFGFAENCAKMAGFDNDLIAIAISKGIAPIVFETMRTDANITIYRQRLFFPLTDDSR